MRALIALLIAFALRVQAFVHPIIVSESQFIDSVSGKPFLIRGVDYQPGGSSRDFENSDPLSDPNSCARDVYLFQQLGINTIRVYSVNPKLNHDECMTMLAAAGIYLILDVNTPRSGENINRYEPWTTYSSKYLRHVFQVIEQFSWYNNTLGYFIGNEIVNDEISASVSPYYIRAVTRDAKDYIKFNAPRIIPVGYSAADDLRYRTDLSHFLTCGDSDSAIDFYGVNSYQWCGKQTFTTSGYDVLVRDHSKLPVPVFLSEFGCNLVRPRIFQEIEAIYSPLMTNVFCGGLVYEFTQEPNDYGLVELDAHGNARLLPDFEVLKTQFEKAVASTREIETAIDLTQPLLELPRPACESNYENLKFKSPALAKLVKSTGTNMIQNGVKANRGKILKGISFRKTSFEITDSKGSLVKDKNIRPVHDFDEQSHTTLELSRREDVSPGSVIKPILGAAASYALLTSLLVFLYS